MDEELTPTNMESGRLEQLDSTRTKFIFGCKDSGTPAAFMAGKAPIGGHVKLRLRGISRKNREASRDTETGGATASEPRTRPRNPRGLLGASRRHVAAAERPLASAFRWETNRATLSRDASSGPGARMHELHYNHKIFIHGT
jgi:hypothetical protein